MDIATAIPPTPRPAAGRQRTARAGGDGLLAGEPNACASRAWDNRTHYGSNVASEFGVHRGSHPVPEESPALDERQQA